MPLRHLHISCSCHCLAYLPAWPAYRPVMSTLETVLKCCAGLEDRRQEGLCCANEPCSHSRVCTFARSSNDRYSKVRYGKSIVRSMYTGTVTAPQLPVCRPCLVGFPCTGSLVWFVLNSCYDASSRDRPRDGLLAGRKAFLTTSGYVQYLSRAVRRSVT